MATYKINQAGINIIKSFESLSLTAYHGKADKPGVWTIGWGTIRYMGGAKVKEGDVITEERADELFLYDLQQIVKDVNYLVTSKITDNQFAALVSFAYNLGSDIDDDKIAEGLGDSTLLKKVNANPNDPTIKQEFYKWVNAGGRPVKGLMRRRKAEVDLYFTK